MALPKLKDLPRKALQRARRGALASRVHALGGRLARTERTPRISVVVPVYNAMPYLTELLNSLEAQDLGKDAFELLAVDDGSTDFSGEILDVYCARNANFHVIHQKNSGWPGKPRNVGVAASEADYVFFCDADDVLGPEALRRMLEFADDNNVDVLAPKMVGLGGRGVQASLFRETVLDVPIRTMLRSLSPQKLVRRSLLVENRIRFHEDKVRLEDGMVMAQCYLKSTRNSILADYPYYHLRLRTDGANISQRRIEPRGYVWSLTQIAQTLREGIHDSAEADRAVLELFQRKGLRFYEPSRFGGYNARTQQQWIAAHREFVDRFIEPGLDASLGERARRQLQLIRAGDVPGMREFCSGESALFEPAETMSVRLSPDAATITIVREATDIDGLELVIRARKTASVRTYPMQRTTAAPGLPSEREAFRADVGLDALAEFGAVLADCFTVASHAGRQGTELRLRASDTPGLPVSAVGIRAYRTVNGSLSLDLRR